MARKPFGSSGAPAIAKMDMRAATEPGRAFGQMFANLGKIAADSLEKYRVNNEKKEREEDIYKMSKTFLVKTQTLLKAVLVRAPKRK